MSNSITSITICQLCNLKLSSTKELNYHIRFKHNISSKEYYDKFHKNIHDGICLNCKKETKFYHLEKGYRLYCSVKCKANHKELRDISNSKLKETYKSNPSIVIDRTNKRLLTEKQNPNIRKNANKKISQWSKDNPSKVKLKALKRNNTINSIPSLRKDINKKLSITMRNYYAELKKSDSSIPYYLYVIEHLEKPIVKIGISENPNKRLNGIIKDFGDSKIIHAVKSTYGKIHKLESYLHNYFKEHCEVQNERKSGRTEWFNKEILGELKNTLQFIDI